MSNVLKLVETIHRARMTFIIQDLVGRLNALEAGYKVLYDTYPKNLFWQGFYAGGIMEIQAYRQAVRKVGMEMPLDSLTAMFKIAWAAGTDCRHGREIEHIFENTFDSP